MCGRYTLLADELKVRSRFNIPAGINAYEPEYNIAPGQDVLAIIHDGEKNRAGYLRWGLVPSWAKDEKIGYKMINARSETAHDKPSFKKLMSRKRCLIVADSFYEWVQTPDGKIAKRIQAEDEGLFAFAGLWDKWQQADKIIFTCTLLTKDSNDFMRDIHHRMPIILPKDKEEQWIKPNFKNEREAAAFIQSTDDIKLKAYSVSNYVNNVRNNGEACIEAL